MIDAYTIGITLALEDGVSDGILAIRRDLVQLDAAVAESAAKLLTLRKLAAGLSIPDSAVQPSRQAALFAPPFFRPQAALLPIPAVEAPAATASPTPPQPTVSPIPMTERASVAPVVTAQSVLQFRPIEVPSTEGSMRSPDAAPPMTPLRPVPPAQPNVIVQPVPSVPAAMTEPRVTTQRSVVSIETQSPQPSIEREKLPDFAAIARSLAPTAPAPPPKSSEPLLPQLALPDPTSPRAIIAPLAMPLPSEPMSRSPPASPPAQVAMPSPNTSAVELPATEAPVRSSIAPPSTPPLISAPRQPEAWSAVAVPPRSGPRLPNGPASQNAPVVPRQSAAPLVQTQRWSTAPDAKESEPSERAFALPSADPRQSDSPAFAEIYLDGAALGRWVTRHLERQVTRPQAGATGFDPRMTPSWAGAPIGN